MSRSTLRPEAGTAPARVEKRAAPRYPIMQRCSVRPAQSSARQAWKCIAYKVSAAGIAIALPIQLPEGTALTIEACDLPGAGPLQARITHTQAVEHAWFTGCEFVQRLSKPELQVWRSGRQNWLDDYHS